MLKWTALALVIAAALAAALFLGGGGAQQDALNGSAGVPVGGEEASGAELLGAGGAPAGEATSAGARSSIGRDSSAPSAGPGSSELLALEAQTAAGGAPAGEIQVWVLDRDGRPAAEWQAAFRQAEDRADYIQEHGAAYTTDGQGRVEVQRVSSGAVFATGAGHRGEAEWMGPIAGPVVIRMQPVMDLRVRVLDAGGLPAASAPVAVFVRAGSQARALVQSVTRTDGVAPFAGLATQLAGAEAGAQLFVALDLPLANPEELLLLPGALPQEVLELHMPPAAPMQIQVLDGNGARRSAQMTLAMGRRAAGSERFVVAKRHVLRHGQLTLNWVEVGIPFDVELSGGGGLAKQVFTVQGPPEADVLHSVDLVWEARHPLLVGRCVGPDGTPLALAAGTLDLMVNSERTKGLGFSCDAKGVFRLRFEQPFERGSERLAAFSIPPVAGGAPLVVSRDLGFEVPPGETNLGDLLFESLPFALSGTALGTDGAPLANVVVTLQHDADGEGTWEKAFAGGDQTGADGRFFLHGTTDKSPLRLVAKRKGFVTAYLEGVSLGERETAITVARDPNAEDAKDK